MTNELWRFSSVSWNLVLYSRICILYTMPMKWTLHDIERVSHARQNTLRLVGGIPLIDTPFCGGFLSRPRAWLPRSRAGLSIRQRRTWWIYDRVTLCPGEICRDLCTYVYVCATAIKWPSLIESAVRRANRVQLSSHQWRRTTRFVYL